ncbi:MAG: ATP-binding protein [Granulosicoccus sp.]
MIALAGLGFIERHQSVHLLGPPGVGKTHLATALGIAAVKARKAVYFTTLADLIAALTKAEREGTLSHRLRYINRASLLIVDEVGYLPIEKTGRTCSSRSSMRNTKKARQFLRPIVTDRGV